MDRILVEGGAPLHGSIAISGAKNAALPVMIASLLTPSPLTLRNVPRLADVQLLMRILRNCGTDSTIHGKRFGEDLLCGDTVTLTSKEVVDFLAPYDLVSKMRASFWVLAPLLARCGEAKVSLPGGCAIGTRPVDLHMHVLECLGAEISLDNGYVCARAPKGLRGGEVVFPKISVGASHTAIMAAVCAHGDTVLRGVAQEPEVQDLARCLVSMGAKISGIGTNTLEIQGVTSLHGAEHTIIPDRIETGTYAIATAMVGGDVLLRGGCADHLSALFSALQEVGAEISLELGGVRVQRNVPNLEALSLETAPYPGFPTDLQAQFMALMTRAQGVSHIRETIFENRFMHVQELARLGARITLSGDTAHVEGVPLLCGAPVMATDLRASVSLIIAALAAQGETTIHRVYHLDRGFEQLEHKLSSCGAQISRVQ